MLDPLGPVEGKHVGRAGDAQVGGGRVGPTGNRRIPYSPGTDQRQISVDRDGAAEAIAERVVRGHQLGLEDPGRASVAMAAFGIEAEDVCAVVHGRWGRAVGSRLGSDQGEVAVERNLLAEEVGHIRGRLGNG